MENQQNCPCGSGKTYNNCCAIAHNNIKDVETPEQLMRSRYTAFTMADGEYLIKSHHSSTRPDSKSEINEIVRWAKSVSWIRLDVLNSYYNKRNEEEGVVEFKAYFLENAKVNYIHETSLFVKENGHWVYKDAL